MEDISPNCESYNYYIRTPLKGLQFKYIHPYVDLTTDFRYNVYVIVKAWARGIWSIRTRGPQAPRASVINRSNTECACFNYFISRCHTVTNKLIGSAHALNSVAIDIKCIMYESFCSKIFFRLKIGVEEFIELYSNGENQVSRSQTLYLPFFPA